MSDNSTNDDFYLSEYENPEDLSVSDGEQDDDSDVSEDSTRSTVHGASKDDPAVGPPSSGPRRSSPVVGSKAERALKRIKKGRVKRKETLEKQKDKQQADRAMQRQADKARQKVVLDEVLQTLRTNNLRFWDLMEYVFNPANGQGAIRYNEFFVGEGNAPMVLDWWMSANNRGRRAKAKVREWITKYAARTMAQEAEAVTKSKALQTMGHTIDAQVIKRFDLEEIHNKLQGDLAPFSMCLLQAFTTAKGVNKHTENRKERTKMVCH